MNWTIISPPKESENENKVQEVISFDYELFRAQNLAKKTKKQNYIKLDTLQTQGSYPQSCYIRVASGDVM